MAHDVNNLDLSVATGINGNELMSRGSQFSGVTCMNVPEGNEFELRYGQNPWMKIPRAFTAKPRGIDSTSGFYWRNLVAQPGVVVQLVVERGAPNEGLDLVLA